MTSNYNDSNIQTMAYSPRIEFPGAMFHITERGNHRQEIFLDDFDRLMFLDLLVEHSRSLDIEVLGLVLMDNHYHLIAQVLKDGISKLMFNVNRGYAIYFNKKYGSCGNVFTRPFYASIIDDERNFFAVCDYLKMNAVRANIVDEPEHYEWAWLHDGTQELADWVVQRSSAVVAVKKEGQPAT